MITLKAYPDAAPLDVKFPALRIVNVPALLKEKADLKKESAKVPATALLP
jgi:hypothetical protein